jgi:hypothetical protein
LDKIKKKKALNQIELDAINEGYGALVYDDL